MIYSNNNKTFIGPKKQTMQEYRIYIRGFIRTFCLKANGLFDLAMQRTRLNKIERTKSSTFNIARTTIGILKQ